MFGACPWRRQGKESGRKKLEHQPDAAGGSMWLEGSFPLEALSTHFRMIPQ